MIRKIYVDGFRSLCNFQMEFRPGLNILIGPNGAGKSNIILFLEFLTKLTTMPAAEAIGTSGGIGLLFQRIGTGEFIGTIRSKIEGDYSVQIENSVRNIRYIYEFDISASDSRDEVFFSHQCLKYVDQAKKIPKKSSNVKWDLVITSDKTQGKPTTYKVEQADLRKRVFEFVPFLSHSSTGISKSERIEAFQIRLRRFIGEGVILPLLFRGYGIVGLIDDLSGGEALNIVPSMLRKSEDGATPPGIKHDGSGLASTIYSLQQIGRKTDQPHGLRQRYYWYGSRTVRRSFEPQRYRSAFKKIVDNVKLVNDQILDLDVETDYAENLLKMFAIMRSKDGDVRLPISLLSDGTIKWIALLTAIFTHEQIFAIEEPENFLHPRMQQEILKIMRTSSEARANESFILMTTHSETLLNAAKPSEIILVTMKEGATESRRIANEEKISEEISRSGFGLGHYYFTGILDHV